MELYLIRHPRPDVPAGVCYGRSDVGLAAPVGPAAARLRALLPAGCRIYSSPALRARLLAEALGEARFDARLQEIDFGDWELRPFEDLRAGLDQWAADPLGFRPPGGESPLEMAARACSMVAELRDRHRDEAVALVAHGGPLRAIAGRLLGLPAARWLALEFGFAELTHIHVDGDSAVLRGSGL